MGGTDHSTLEVNTSARDAEGLQTYEAYHKSDALHPHDAGVSIPMGATQPFKHEPGSGAEEHIKRSHGKRRTRCMLAVFALFIVIAVGVGVGVGLRVTRSNSKDAVEDNRPVDSISRTGLSSSSRIASVNWTSSTSEAATYYWVYFQDESSNALYQSKWESKSEEWKVTPITEGNIQGAEHSINVLPGTTIAAVVNSRGDSAERRIYFLDEKRNIVELSTLTANDEDTPWTRTSNIQPLVDAYAENGTAETPPLAAFWTPSSDLDDGRDAQQGNITVVFVGDNLDLNACSSDGGWSCHSYSFERKPIKASPLALVGAGLAGDILARHNMKLYFFSGGSIQEYNYRYGKWQIRALIDTLVGNNENAMLAGYSYGYNDTGEITLIASRPSGGVSISQWRPNDDELWEPPVDPLVLQGIINNSAVATNHDRRVYGMVESSGEIEIVEYTTDFSWNWVPHGPVNTTIPK